MWNVSCIFQQQKKQQRIYLHEYIRWRIDKVVQKHTDSVQYFSKIFLQFRRTYTLTKSQIHYSKETK